MNLSMTRGDTAKFSFYRKDKDGNVIKRQPEAIYFTIKSNEFQDEAIIKKTLEDMTFDSETGKYIFYINPEDIKDVDYGMYQYDLEVKDSIDNEDYTKTIAIGFFEIKKEITYISNEV